MTSLTNSSTFLSYLNIDIGPVVDQELQTERSVCGGRSEVQGSEPLVVGLADVGAPVDQLADDRVLAVKAGQVEGRVPKRVGVVNLWSLLQHRVMGGDYDPVFTPKEAAVTLETCCHSFSISAYVGGVSEAMRAT